MKRSFDEALPLRRYTIDNQKVSGRVISELRITQANHIDRGDYTCVATNAYGHARAGIKLLVQEPPNFPRNLHVAEQGSRSLLLAWSSPSSEQDPAHASSPITKYIVQYKEAQGRFRRFVLLAVERNAIGSGEVASERWNRGRINGRDIATRIFSTVSQRTVY